MFLNIFGKRIYEMIVWMIIIRDRCVYCCVCKFYIYFVCSILYKLLLYVFVVCVWYLFKFIIKMNLVLDFFNNY